MDFLVDYLKKPQWGSQHRWRRAIWNTMSRVGLTGVHALPLNRRWVEIHRRRMPLVCRRPPGRQGPGWRWRASPSAA